MKDRKGYYRNMPSKEYWQKRSQENLNEVFKRGRKLERIEKRFYRDELLRFVKAYKSMVEPFIENGKLNANKLHLERSTNPKFEAQLRRLEEQISGFRKLVGNAQIRRMERLLGNIRLDTIKTICADLGKKPSIYLTNKTAIHNAIYTPWTKDGREFSERIWNNLDKMEKALRREMATSIAEGKSFQDTTRNFKKIFGNTTYNTQRLIRTETNAIYTQTAIDTYRDNNIADLEIIGDGCDVCSKHKYVKVSEAIVGVSVSPFHPNCKCCVAPIVKW